MSTCLASIHLVHVKTVEQVDLRALVVFVFSLQSMVYIFAQLFIRAM